MGAASRVLAIPELLEAVLIRLPTKDLLLLQRVATLWKQTVEESLTLRQALFLEPMAPSTGWIVQDRDADLQDIVSGQYFKLETDVVLQLPAIQFMHRIQLDCRERSRLDSKEGAHRFRATLNEAVLERGHWRDVTLRERVWGGEAIRMTRPRCAVSGSGLRMYLTQPPCTELMYWLNWGSPVGIKRKDGIRFEDILREIQGAAVTPYLPYIYMRLRDTICPTKEEDEEIADRMAQWQALITEAGEEADNAVDL